MCTSRCKSNDMCLCTSLWNVPSRCQSLVEGDLFLCGESCCEKNHPKTGGIFLFGMFFFAKKKPSKIPEMCWFPLLGFFFGSDWLMDSPKMNFLQKRRIRSRNRTKNQKSWGECHWNLGEGDWCACGETGGSATGLIIHGGQCDVFFLEPWTGCLGWY